MKIIMQMVTNIVLIVFFATTLEIIMPNRKNIGKYINLIMGLLIIITILNPILNLMNSKEKLIDFTSFVSAKDLEKYQLEDKGKDLKDRNDEVAKKIAAENLEKQIMALTNLIDGISSTDVQVVLEEKGDYQNYIKEIRVKTKTEGKEELVKPVNVDLKNKEEEIKNEENNEVLVGKIKETLSSFYGVNKEKIKIVFN